MCTRRLLVKRAKRAQKARSCVFVCLPDRRLHLATVRKELLTRQHQRKQNVNKRNIGARNCATHDAYAHVSARVRMCRPARRRLRPATELTSHVFSSSMTDDGDFNLRTAAPCTQRCDLRSPLHVSAYLAHRLQFEFQRDLRNAYEIREIVHSRTTWLNIVITFIECSNQTPMREEPTAASLKQNSPLATAASNSAASNSPSGLRSFSYTIASSGRRPAHSARENNVDARNTRNKNQRVKEVRSYNLRIVRLR